MSADDRLLSLSLLYMYCSWKELKAFGLSSPGDPVSNGRAGQLSERLSD